MTEQVGESRSPDDEAPGGVGYHRDEKALAQLLVLMSKHKASDLHLKVGSPPLLRVGGRVVTVDVTGYKPGEIPAMLWPILSDAQREAMDRGEDLDFAYALEGTGRYRVNLYRQRGSVSAAIRRVRTAVPTFEDLHLPVEAMKRIAAFQRGLVLVCGVTGSGKTTTLAALLEHINQTRRCHIMTIEDPIEYLYRDKKAFVNQREVGIDVPDFRTALRHMVRQDPDVILIGEMRDRETLEAALAAAETGHLVFGTLHSGSTGATIGRILDFFPPERSRQVRQTLRFNLRAIVCQKILPGAKKSVPLVPCLEVLLVNAAARKALQDGEDKKLDHIVRAGKEDGMIDFNRSLIGRVRAGLVSEKVAVQASPNPEQLRMNLKGIFLADDRKILS